MMISSKQDYTSKHSEISQEVCSVLGLPEEVSNLSMELWERLLMDVPRTPIRLLADCIYLIAFMTGRRVSIPKMADAFLIVTGYRVRVMPKDNRRENTRWVENERLHPDILAVIPDEEALHFLLSQYP